MCMLCLFVALAFCLFGSARGLRSYGTVGTWIQEIEFTLRDTETQWMVFACLAVYFVTFAILRRRQVGRHSERAAVLNPNLPLNLNPDSGARGATRPTSWFSNPDLWLIVGLIITVLTYAFQYSAASKSTEALVLLGGIVLGKGAAVWARWGRAAAEDGRWKMEDRRAGAVIFIFTVLLLFGCFWQSEELRQFQYRGQERWNGSWDNPNIFGMLMGVGVVLALGQVLIRVGNIQPSTFNLQPSTGKSSAWRWAQIPFCLTAAGVMSFGLIKSYSRGAWLATAMGLAYLGYQRFNHEIHQTHEKETPSPPIGFPFSAADGEKVAKPDEVFPRGVERAGVRWVFARLCSCISCLSWSRRNCFALGLLVLSLAVITFWNYRHTERTVARRAFSVGNVNDFSWRNRVAAWEGALQIMAEEPWLGAGWNQPQRLYDHYYLPAKASESAAIQLNDYLMLGMTLGLPALVCFGAYIAMSLSPKSIVQSLASKAGDLRLQTPDSRLKAACRAGAIVPLVAFCFDGGLFKLATGATFWILLELGREE